MTYNDIVLNYINDYPFDEPIFVEDIKKYVKDNIGDKIHLNKVFRNINVLLNRLTKKKKIYLYIRGIYYKPTTGIFGVRGLDTDKVICKKYLEDNGNVKGYFSGAVLFNALGLTTQIPRYKLIITNECNIDNVYNDKKLCVAVKKPKIKIDNNNYIYLQLLDLLANKEQINIEVENEKEIIYKFIKENNLEFDKIFMYAKLTNNKKAIEHLYELG